jgi:UDP-N-acetylglucosamine acyltransferase
MAYVHIAHDCVVGNHCILANAVTLAGHIEVDDFAILEGLVAVQQFIRIGTYSFIGGGAHLRKNIPPFVKAANNPVSYIGVNSVGLRRKGFSEEKIKEIQDIYRIIFVKGLNLSNALPLVESEIPSSKERDSILSFIKSSERGIIRGLSQAEENGE